MALIATANRGTWRSREAKKLKGRNTLRVDLSYRYSASFCSLAIDNFAADSGEKLCNVNERIEGRTIGKA